MSEQSQIQNEIDAPNTQIHDRSLSLLGTGSSIKSGGIKLVLWTKYLSEIMRCFPRVTKMPILMYTFANSYKVERRVTSYTRVVDIFYYQSVENVKWQN